MLNFLNHKNSLCISTFKRKQRTSHHTEQQYVKDAQTITYAAEEKEEESCFIIRRRNTKNMT